MPAAASKAPDSGPNGETRPKNGPVSRRRGAAGNLIATAFTYVPVDSESKSG